VPVPEPEPHPKGGILMNVEEYILRGLAYMEEHSVSGEEATDALFDPAELSGPALRILARAGSVSLLNHRVNNRNQGVAEIAREVETVSVEEVSTGAEVEPEEVQILSVIRIYGKVLIEFDLTDWESYQVEAHAKKTGWAARERLSKVAISLMEQEHVKVTGDLSEASLARLSEMAKKSW
jgi:hypothetical protein